MQLTSKKPLLQSANAAGYLLAISGFIISVIAFYPGYMTPDSLDQWHQGRAWNFYDFHPPMMSALWGLLDRVIPGPFGMLLFHNALFWAAAAVFWRATKRESRWLGLGLVVFAVMPQVVSLLGTIWKDVGMGASLLLVSALLYTAHKSGSRLALILSSPFLYYGYGVRMNAAPAVLPLAIWTGYLACRIFPRLRSKAESFKLLPVVCGVIYMLLLTAAVVATTQALTHGKTSHVSQALFLHDLAAISKARGEVVFPDYITRDKNFSLESVAQKYDSYAYTNLTTGETRPLRLTENPEELKALRSKWIEAVLYNKMIYLRHRWEIFANLIAFNTQHVMWPYNYAGYGYNPPQYRPQPSALNQSLMAYFWYFQRSLFYRGFFWLLLCAGLLYVCLRCRLEGDLEVVFVLSTSGLLYTAAYFFIAPSTEFRYLWWTTLAATISALLTLRYAVVHLRRAARSSERQELQVASTA